MKKTKRARRLAITAMMGALSFVLMYFSFSVPVLSPFAEFELSGLPELIGGFILGPAGAVEIIVVKILLKLAFKGTQSMFTGELQSLLLSIAFVLPAVLYYRKHKNKHGAIIGLVIGSICSILVSIVTNIFIVFPFYIYLYGMNWDQIVSICSAVNPWIKNIPTMIVFSILPFNIISRGVTAIITFFLYKKISKPIKHLID